MATKNYKIGPQDGWVKVLDAGVAFVVQISAYPHTHPFYVWGDPIATPTAADVGVLVCHSAFHIENSNDIGNVDAFWVRTSNPSNQGGRIRIDLYTDGGTPH